MNNLSHITQARPIPKAIVQISTCKGALEQANDFIIMLSCTSFCVTLEYMSTNLNLARLGAPTGSVHSWPNEQ